MKSLFKLTIAVFFGALPGSAMEALYAQQVGGAGRVLQRADLAGVPRATTRRQLWAAYPSRRRVLLRDGRNGGTGRSRRGAKSA
jgi:hypothetical protein